MYMCVYINIILYVVCRGAFHVDTFPKVFSPKSIKNSLVLRMYYMFHPALSSLFDHSKNIVIKANNEASYCSNSTRSPLPRPSQG